MGSMPSAFRHFINARECKEPSVSSFKRVLAGASPATGAISHNGRVAQLAEARRRERRECWFKSCRDYHFEPEALIAKPPPFKRLRRVQVPTGSFPFRRNRQTRSRHGIAATRSCTSANRRIGNRLKNRDGFESQPNRSTAVTRAQAQPRRSLRSQPKGHAARCRAVAAAVDRNFQPTTNTHHDHRTDPHLHRYRGRRQHSWRAVVRARYRHEFIVTKASRVFSTTRASSSKRSPRAATSAGARTSASRSSIRARRCSRSPARKCSAPITSA